ncbi:MAG TPA: 4-alpha-glucanotransferase [Thermogutta sp.]|nr:4-alpha-glucanotransferase [Thermogutta sp.]
MRESGILLHPSSLPSPMGIGDLGSSAYRFVEWLALAKQRYWQVLPLGPVDDWGSPYSSPSAFAGNELLISLELLAEDGLLDSGELKQQFDHTTDDAPVDYRAVFRKKMAFLKQAFERFEAGRVRNAFDVLREEFELFCEQQSWWLKTYAIYQALVDLLGNNDWPRWPRHVLNLGIDRLRRGGFDALGTDLPGELGKEYRFHCFAQFVFGRQWEQLHRFALERDVRIFGDIPIYVSYHSADVWANPQYFFLDEHYRPIAVAGVPPDYFNATGQLWGNPVYRWEVIQSEGYRWWIDRFRAVFRLVDLARVDHFRGFAAFWSVPASHETAERGHWVTAPGEDLFTRLTTTWEGPWRQLPDGRKILPIVAEDLGHITPDVIALRRKFGFPGMAVLQFAFGASQVDAFLPDHVAVDTVMYSGTHDNDTSLGWFVHEILPHPQLHERLRRYCAAKAETISWDMIRLAFESRSQIAIVPLQDVLGLGSEARMNIPGTPDNNWRWRFSFNSLSEAQAERLARLSEDSGRNTETAIVSPVRQASPAKP